MSARSRAEAINTEAMQAADEGRLEEAIALYERAMQADPSWAAPAYNLGLLFKYQLDWERSLKFNQVANRLQPDHEAATWNLGIAATALGRWDLARQAWKDYGIELPEGEGPVELPCGYAPIRLNPDGNGEVVWCHRIDPARALIDSIPYPESGYRYCDEVLNDGAPTGKRMLNGREVPVFDALQLLRRSRFGTYVANVVGSVSGEAVDTLKRLARERDGSAEDWSTSVRVLCKQCSEGLPHDDHDRAREELGAHRVAIAAHSREHASTILLAWEGETPSIEIEWLEDAVPTDQDESDET